MLSSSFSFSVTLWTPQNKANSMLFLLCPWRPEASPNFKTPQKTIFLVCTVYNQSRNNKQRRDSVSHASTTRCFVEVYNYHIKNASGFCEENKAVIPNNLHPVIRTASLKRTIVLQLRGFSTTAMRTFFLFFLFVCATLTKISSRYTYSQSDGLTSTAIENGPVSFAGVNDSWVVLKLEIETVLRFPVGSILERKMATTMEMLHWRRWRWACLTESGYSFS